MGLDGGYVADNAVLGKYRHNFPKHIDSVIERNSINYQLRTKLGNFLQSSEAEGVIHKSEFAGIGFVDGCLMVKTEKVYKEGSHLACS